jgi:hypothetical protein
MAERALVERALRVDLPDPVVQAVAEIDVARGVGGHGQGLRADPRLGRGSAVA